MTIRNEFSIMPGARLGLVPDRRLPRLHIPFSPHVDEIAIPATDDHLASVPAWNLGANNRFGTCGPTSFANYITMVYWNLLQQPVTVSDEAVFALYRNSGNPQFNPATGADDNGVDMVTMLNAASDVGIDVTHADGSTEQVKAVAFGQVQGDIASIRNATACFGGAILAVDLQTAQQSQTSTGVWDWNPSPVWGGHAIMGAAYTGQVSGADESVITWAERVGLSDAFVQRQLAQAFAVILPVHLSHPNFLAGVDQAQLAADYQALTGNPFPSV